MENEQHFLIVIGARNNTHTTLRKQKSEFLLFENITPDVLSPDVPIKIRLQIMRGRSVLFKFQNLRLFHILICFQMVIYLFLLKMK